MNNLNIKVYDIFEMNSIEINLDNHEINQQLAEVCGIHAGDGYLRNDGKRREWDISGSVEEKDYYDEHMIPLFNKLFNLNIKGKFFSSRNTYGFVIRDKKVIEFAHSILGFPYGNKSMIITVPNFIQNSLPLIRKFLRGYFDTDGHFSCTKKYGTYSEFKKKFHCYPRITFSTVSPNLSNNLRKLLQIIGLKYSFHNYKPLKKTESLKYVYEIYGSERTQKFMDLVKPKNTMKTSRFIIWQKFGFCPTNITFQQRQNIINDELDPYMFYKGL
ncbi:MAG: hypothetical protein KAT43_04080 [Nanoarchaeota archaeon]|nr:hypothetical protein [Nanoarchaeota archaeon]